MRKTILLFIILVSSSTWANDEASSIEALEAFDAWLYESFFNSSRVAEKMILDLGKPERISKSEYRVGHATSPLKSVIYEFSGLEICAIVEQNGDKAAHITRIKLQSENWKLTNGISIGQNTEILSSLPVSPDEGTNKYCGINNCINFGISAGRISGVEINLYAD